MDGLPNDAFSVDNAIVLKNARRWPLIIDPQMQAVRWIKNMERQNKLKVFKPTDDYNRTLEAAIQLGFPCLLEQVGEQLDPALEPLLLKSTFKRAGRLVLKFGDKELDYNSRFKFYMATKLSNPHYYPEVSVKVCLLNFMVTPEGLEDQLLGIVVAKERAELEEERTELVRVSAENAAKLKTIEDKILEVLSSSQGNILDDESAIKVLQSSKALSNDIEAKQKTMRKAQAEIEKTRKGYVPVAKHTTILFFCINSLKAIDPMYQYSLSWFISLFNRAIDNSEYSDDLPQRIESLNSFFTYSLYLNICRSLFGKDKLLFSFLLTSKLMEAGKLLDESELRFLLTGGVGVERNMPENPASGWLSARSWLEIVRLSKIPSMQQGFNKAFAAARADEESKSKQDSADQKSTGDGASDSKGDDDEKQANGDAEAGGGGDGGSGGDQKEGEQLKENQTRFMGAVVDIESEGSLVESFQMFPGDWKKIYDSPTPHKVPFPGRWAKDLSPFRKLMVLRCLRPDKLLVACREFVNGSMGEKFTQIPSLDIAECFGDSSPASPLIFILSMGSDPWVSISKYAEDVKFSDKMQSISLGQGQGEKAKSMIDRASKEGTWVILQNCHLMESWMPKLELICENISNDTAHPSFRLWRTSYPSPKFPITVLHNGVKMTTDQPKGLTNNLANSYNLDPISQPDFFKSCRKSDELRRMTYSLCFFHALIQERRSFGPVGWNIPYGFNASDLRISVQQLHMFLNKDGPTIPYKALRYLVGQCNYGGRVTDDRDRRCLVEILDTFLSEDVHKQGYKLSPSGVYKIPRSSDSAGYVSFIRKLPLTIDPEVFGFHENADITKDQQETNLLLSSILSTLDRRSSGQGKSQESILEELSNDILGKLDAVLPDPKGFDEELVARKYPVEYSESMNTVLQQECIRYNKLTVQIRSTLKLLQQALKGEVVMSTDLERMAGSMSIGRVPTLWTQNNTSYPSLKPLMSYVDDLVKRLSFFATWIREGKPTVMWISGIFFTQALLTGALQNFARKYTLPIDEIDFDFEFMKKGAVDQKSPKPKDGIYINGLFLEAARWNDAKMELAESLPKVLFSGTPVIWLKPALIKNLSKFKGYECPVYRTTARHGQLSTTGHSTNFVMFIKMPTSLEPGHWVKRGVAMVTMLDD